MRLTLLILLLPVAIFFGWILLQPRLGEAGDSLIPIWFTIWMFATLVCFVWGFFIFRRYRRLVQCNLDNGHAADNLGVWLPNA
jgi:hypothetical protein